jgi:hypothetical protein
MSDDAVGVGLSDAIATIRAELEQAIAAGKNSTLGFRAGPVEMEFQVSFSRTGMGETGIKAWVVTVGAKGEATTAATHRLKFTMTPVRRDDNTDALIGDVGDR